MSAHDTHHDHPLHLNHQFENMEQQNDSYILGMWVFLCTEILFFGGLFTAFIVYHKMYPEAFFEAHHELSIMLGGINTTILLFSSFTIALAVRAAALGRWKAQLGLMGITLACAFGFMVVKAIEYTEKYNHHLIPGPKFHFETAHEHGAQIFFSLYFAMTGLHGIHVLIGIIACLILMYMTWKNRNKPQDFMPIEMFGLYWHFVDIVWIFLYPLLYLIGK